MHTVSHSLATDDRIADLTPYIIDQCTFGADLERCNFVRLNRSMHIEVDLDRSLCPTALLSWQQFAKAACLESKSRHQRDFIPTRTQREKCSRATLPHEHKHVVCLATAVPSTEQCCDLFSTTEVRGLGR